MNFRAQATTSINTAVLREKLRVAVQLSVEQSCELIADEARSICPVDTGELRDSIVVVPPVVEGSTVVGGVAATAGHAAFVEFGTGLRGMGTYPGPLPQEGVPFTGSWVYDYKHQKWVGHASQSFMRPAVDAARDRIKGIFVSNVKMAVK
jgi:HK97 gp10 family phage protein